MLKRSSGFSFSWPKSPLTFRPREGLIPMFWYVQAVALCQNSSICWGRLTLGLGGQISWRQQGWDAVLKINDVILQLCSHPDFILGFVWFGDSIWKTFGSSKQHVCSLRKSAWGWEGSMGMRYDVLDHTNHIFSESLSSDDDNDRDKDLQKDKYKDKGTQI